MKHYGPEEIPLWGILLIGIILITQGSILYIKARKRGKAPWLWGIIGLIQFPIPSLVYLILTKTVWSEKKNTKGSDHS
ncbi:sigma-Y antisigma factor component [Halobacillus halophilus]|nr:hypothetical protein [Halobacillus halophilus]ASF38451.1 sigma-Y antisigma factor component [Halobacillus halophilus]